MTNVPFETGQNHTLMNIGFIAILKHLKDIKLNKSYISNFFY